MEDFGAHTDSLGDVAGTDWDNHVFLEIRRPICVSATVHDVHHWHWQAHFVGGAGEFCDVFVEPLALSMRNCLCGSKRYG